MQSLNAVTVRNLISLIIALSGCSDARLGSKSRTQKAGRFANNGRVVSLRNEFLNNFEIAA
jgi:hypothetical protein